jgi:hypothetical protein
MKDQVPRICTDEYLKAYMVNECLLPRVRRFAAITAPLGDCRGSEREIDKILKDLSALLALSLD